MAPVGHAGSAVAPIPGTGRSLFAGGSPTVRLAWLAGSAYQQWSEALQARGMGTPRP